MADLSSPGSKLTCSANRGRDARGARGAMAPPLFLVTLALVTIALVTLALVTFAHVTHALVTLALVTIVLVTFLN